MKMKKLKKMKSHPQKLKFRDISNVQDTFCLTANPVFLFFFSCITFLKTMIIKIKKGDNLIWQKLFHLKLLLNITVHAWTFYN